MIKKYKNALFEHLEKSPIGLNNVNVEFDKGNIDCQITYKLFDGLFEYRFYSSGRDFDFFQVYATEFAPGFAVAERSNAYMHFEGCLKDIDRWYKDHLLEYIQDNNAPDLWDAYHRRVDLTDVSQIDYNNSDVFTPTDIQQIRNGINEIKYLIPQKFNLLQEQTSLVNSRLDYLAEALDRLGKRDWNGVFISTIISIITTLSLDSNQGKALWDMFLTLVNIVPLLK